MRIHRVVHWSILCDPIKPNPSADWPNPTQPTTSGKIWTKNNPNPHKAIRRPPMKIVWWLIVSYKISQKFHLCQSAALSLKMTTKFLPITPFLRFLLIRHHSWRCKKVKVAHTRLPSVAFRSWSRFWQSAASDVCHKRGGRLPLLSARPAVTLATLKRAATNFAVWWTEARWVWTLCLRLSPDSVAAEIWTQALLCLSPAR